METCDMDEMVVRVSLSRREIEGACALMVDDALDVVGMTPESVEVTRDDVERFILSVVREKGTDTLRSAEDRCHTMRWSRLDPAAEGAKLARRLFPRLYL